MKLKKVATILFASALIFSASIPVSANSINQPKDGFEIESTEYNSATYNGSAPQTRATVVLNSWVQRYRNSSTNNYYASGGVHLINNANKKDVYHSTTVQLEKGSTVLVSSGKEYGTGNVEATTGETPTSGEAKVYYAY